MGAGCWDGRLSLLRKGLCKQRVPRVAPAASPAEFIFFSATAGFISNSQNPEPGERPEGSQLSSGWVLMGAWPLSWGILCPVPELGSNCIAAKELCLCHRAENDPCSLQQTPLPASHVCPIAQLSTQAPRGTKGSLGKRNRPGTEKQRQLPPW